MWELNLPRLDGRLRYWVSGCNANNQQRRILAFCVTTPLALYVFLFLYRLRCVYTHLIRSVSFYNVSLNFFYKHQLFVLEHTQSYHHRAESKSNTADNNQQIWSGTVNKSSRRCRRRNSNRSNAGNYNNEKWACSLFIHMVQQWYGKMKSCSWNTNIMIISTTMNGCMYDTKYHTHEIKLNRLMPILFYTHMMFKKVVHII